MSVNPVVSIKDRINELKRELKHWERVLDIAQPRDPKPSTLEGFESRVLEFLDQHDRLEGYRAVDITRQLSLPSDNAVREFLRKSSKVKKVTKGSRNERFRLKAKVEAVQVVTKSKPASVKPKPTPRLRGGGRHGVSEKRRQVQSILREALTRQKGIIIPDIVKRYNIEPGMARKIVEALVDAEVLKPTDEFVYSNPEKKGRQARVYKSLIYVNTRPLDPLPTQRETRIRPGEGVEAGRLIS